MGHSPGACALLSDKTCYIDGVCYFDFETPRGFHGTKVSVLRVPGGKVGDPATTTCTRLRC